MTVAYCLLCVFIQFIKSTFQPLVKVAAQLFPHIRRLLYRWCVLEDNHLKDKEFLTVTFPFINLIEDSSKLLDEVCGDCALGEVVV